MPFKIAVAGANGHTGKFVMNHLRRMNHDAIPLTRNGEFVPSSGIQETGRAIDCSDQASLDRGLVGCDAVLNCAGPFFDTAKPMAEAAIRAGIPYLDVTAEQGTARSLFDELDAPAKAAGITILPAMAFYGGLADLLTTAVLQGRTRVTSVDIAVGLTSWHPTEGTRKTGARNIAPRVFIRDGVLAQIPTKMPNRNWHFAAPIGEVEVQCLPLSEIILIDRHVQAQSVTSYINLKPLEDLHDNSTPPPLSVTDDGRSAQQFVMEVEVADGDWRTRVSASGRDIYAATAPLIVGACLKLLNGPPTRAGVRAPGEIFDCRAFLADLTPEIQVKYS